MSLALLELGVSALGGLVGEVVFTGGATVGLWITDPAAPEPRPTDDVDVIVGVTSRGRFADFEQRLRERRFRDDQESGIICRWRHTERSGARRDADGPTLLTNCVDTSPPSSHVTEPIGASSTASTPPCGPTTRARRAPRRS